MSVTLVAPQAKASAPVPSEPVASTAAGADDAGAMDFASLLRGQMTPAPAAVVADLRPPLKTSLDTGAAEPATASLLATLGLIAPHTVPTMSDAEGKSAGDGDALSAAVDSSGLGEKPAVLPVVGPAAPHLVAGPALSSEPRAASPAKASASSLPLAAADKPAKLAVAATISEPPAGASASVEITPPSVSSLAGHAHHAAQRSHAGAPDVSLTLATPLRAQNWASDFGQKIVWLATSDKQIAQLTLNPPQMGPIEISVNVEKGTATASFVSASADVREAIETALPKLREMLANAGIALGQTNVGAESFRQQAQSGEGNLGTSRGPADNAILVTDPAALPSREFSGQRGHGMVDIFA